MIIKDSTWKSPNSMEICRENHGTKLLVLSIARFDYRRVMRHYGLEI
jgi:hypothetical protein